MESNLPSHKKRKVCKKLLTGLTFFCYPVINPSATGVYPPPGGACRSPLDGGLGRQEGYPLNTTKI